MPKQSIKPQSIFRLQLKHGIAMGPGKADLLEHISELGSISKAGKAMGMSYRTAWQLVTTMNEHFVAPLVLSTKGGTNGGGAQLTPLGKDVLARYRAMEARALGAIDQDITELSTLIRM